MERNRTNTQHHARHGERGFTVLETLVAMTLFAIGVLGLAQVQFAASRVNQSSKATSTATMLASDRLEEVINSTTFDNITSANFPDEAYGGIEGDEGRYSNYRRDVTITDTQDVAGNVVMKTVTVNVAWQALNGEREVELVSRIARY